MNFYWLFLNSYHVFSPVISRIGEMNDFNVFQMIGLKVLQLSTDIIMPHRKTTQLPSLLDVDPKMQKLKLHVQRLSAYTLSATYFKVNFCKEKKMLEEKADT